MPLTALIVFATLHTLPQSLRDGVTMKGMRLYARCWRTPTGDNPYMIWTIGSRDNPPSGQEWRITGDSISFEGLPIEPAAGFSKMVAASDPDHVGGPMVVQPQGRDAKVAIIEGTLEKVETLAEDLPLGDVQIVKAAHQDEGLGPAYHIVIDHPIKLTTPSGITIEIPKQDAKSTFKYGALGPRPMVAIHFHADFKDTEDKIPGSSLYRRLGGPVEVEAQLKGVETASASGFVGSDYIAESEGFGIKPGPAKDLKIEIIQTVVLQSYPLDFRVPVKDSN